MNSSRYTGFTLIEIMVVISIISILLSTIYISFESARESARDAQRKTDLAQLQLAIELYEAQNGRYPEQGCSATTTTNWTGPGPQTNPWAGTCEEWIVGLVPDYIDELPEDPKFEYEDNRGYLYRTDGIGSIYKVLAHNTAESALINSHEEKFARCPVECNSDPTLWCNGGWSSAERQYALYSPGAECF